MQLPEWQVNEHLSEIGTFHKHQMNEYTRLRNLPPVVLTWHDAVHRCDTQGTDSLPPPQRLRSRSK